MTSTFTVVLVSDSSFMSDTTGSGKDTSLLGNALDKGVGYNLLRYQQIISLEVVLWGDKN